ncbi:MAG: TolC family protein [Bacteroidetes bacterium]|uniref:TolC family protein n=1 Tax=Candidatus Cryptobacteroides merdigallinarum TaxID=2840770 RepID=A0A9D9EKG3_9BACT|nr:TolC family protein [Candidatus Cryptobacteroides merdigallinarum]
MKSFSRTCLALCAASVLSAAAATAQDSTGTVPEIWTLEDCIRYAVSNNITIRQSRLNTQSAEIDIKTSRAAMFPSLSFSTSQSVINRPYQENSTTVSGTELLLSNSSTSYSGSYGLNAQWTLFNGGRLRKTVKQDELAHRQSMLEEQTQSNSIVESIASTYIQILYAGESVNVNRNTLEVSIAQMERGKELLDAGSLSTADYAQLEAQVSNDRYQLVVSENSLAEYKLQLKQLLELEPGQEMEIAVDSLPDDSAITPLPDKLDVYEAALGSRPEIQAAELAVESSEMGIRISRSGYYPSITLSAGIGTNHTSGTDFTFAEQLKNGWNNSAGLTVNVPIFSNRQTKSAVQKARLQHTYSQLDLTAAQKDLYRTIEGIWLDAYNAQQQFIAAQDNVRSSGISYSLVSEQFNLGMKNTVELLTEKNNYLSARQQLLQAKYMSILNARLLDFYAEGIVSFEQYAGSIAR